MRLQQEEYLNYTLFERHLNFDRKIQEHERILLRIYANAIIPKRKPFKVKCLWQRKLRLNSSLKF